MALLTTAQAAEIIGVTPSRVTQYCRAGLLRAVKERHGPQMEWRIRRMDAVLFVCPKITGRPPKSKAK